MGDSSNNKKKLLGVPIKINLDININGKSENVILTSSMIYIPSDEDTENSLKSLETYPRIPTQKVRLPVDYLKSLKYKEVVNFFFNKQSFNGVMEKYQPVLDENNKYQTEKTETMTETISNMTSEIKEGFFSSSASDKQKEIILIEKLNIELMIHLLFPTFSFYSEGYKTSMQYWNSSEGYLTTNPITPFSYLRYNETIYTITNAVWLNDMFNVPFYRELIESYENYKNWKLEVVYYLETIMEKLQDKLNRMNSKENKEEFKEESKEIKTEIDDFKEKIQLLNNENGNIISKKKYEELIESKLYRKYIKPVISQNENSQKPTYIYDIIFSSDETLTYSNTQLNEIIYSYKNENDINNKKMFEIMMENISEFLENKGDVSYLKREICEGKEGCSSNVEMSSFYYTGILYNHHLKNNEPIYETYFLIDVIEGEVNETNIAGIKCKYDNESIGKRIEFLSNQWPVWDLSNRRIFMKLNSGDEKPLVTKTMTEYHSNLSASSSSKDTNYSKMENVQKTVEKLIEFDGTQMESKFKNALELLYENTTYKEKDKPSFDNKVKKLELSFKDKDKLELELNNIFIKKFTKWLQNPNKYPPPPKKETNDNYTSVDKYIYELLDKTQSKNTKTDDLISYTTKLIRKIQMIEDNNNNYDFDNYDNTNALRLEYINYILIFYTGFLTSLSKYLENKNQRGGYVLQEEEDSQNSSNSLEKISHTKTQKQSSQEKKRITRKRVIF